MSKAPSIGDVIRTYVSLRKQKDALEADIKDKVSGIKIKMEKLESYLKAKLDADGVTSFKSEHGTAFLTTTDYANVADWDAVLEFIKENDTYEMLERRVAKKAVREYIEECKQVPPGVTYGTRISVNIRKS